MSQKLKALPHPVKDKLITLVITCFLVLIAGIVISICTKDLAIFIASILLTGYFVSDYIPVFIHGVNWIAASCVDIYPSSELFLKGKKLSRIFKSSEYIAEFEYEDESGNYQRIFDTLPKSNKLFQMKRPKYIVGNAYFLYFPANKRFPTSADIIASRIIQTEDTETS